MEPNPSSPVDPVGGSLPRDVGSAPAGAFNLDPQARDANSGIGRTYITWLQPRLEPTWKYACFRCRNASLADDLVQAVSEKLFKMWPNDIARRSIKEGDLAYLRKAIDSAYVDFGRKCWRDERRADKLRGNALDALRSTIGGPDLETVWTVRDAVRSLEDEQRMIIYLAYYEGHSVSEAGRQIGLSAGKAHRVHESALKRLRSLLQPDATEKASGH
ncbi:RNA polymerase sigma factor [Dactylosporangium sp. CS-033363]|uniref:RNA polymerase sigma factor n=1 Tax=Dactylosporangium sp. CS-033363 TaxID=3239935 RepID=UPI003D8E21C3